MAWIVNWEAHALKELKKLDRSAQQEITRYFRERIATQQNPRRFGKALTGDKIGLWRYRVADYRMICQIHDHQLTVLVLRVGHRRQVYR